MHGYGGTMLRVDLGTGSLRFEPIDEAFARTWLGGNGFAARVILDGDGPLAAPLSRGEHPGVRRRALRRNSGLGFEPGHRRRAFPRRRGTSRIRASAETSRTRRN